MSSYGNDLVCKTINGKAPSDSDTIDLKKVLGNGNDAGGAEIDGVQSYKGVNATLTNEVSCITFVVSGSQVLMTGLPTTDPNVVNRLWNEGGTLKISTGAS
jgi:hypothetical protein